MCAHTVGSQHLEAFTCLFCVHDGLFGIVCHPARAHWKMAVEEVENVI
jgi:hypothetical protein